MKKSYYLIPGLIAVTVALSSTNALAQTTAAGIEDDLSGTPVTYGSEGAYPVISAVLSAPVGSLDGYTYTSYAFLAQDSTGSIDMFNSATTTAGAALFSSYTPTPGQSISVAGSYGPFDAIPEISAITAITLQGTGSVPSPTVTTIPQINVTSLNPTTQLSGPNPGYYLQLNNVTINESGAGDSTGTTFPTHANGTYTISDGVNSMVMYFWASSYSTVGAMGGTTIPTGTVDMTGFLDYYAPSSEAEFVPTTITSVPEPSVLNLCGMGGAGSVLAWMFRSRKKA
jgi:hypothetical protein